MLPFLGSLFLIVIVEREFSHLSAYFSLNCCPTYGTTTIFFFILPRTVAEFTPTIHTLKVTVSCLIANKEAYTGDHDSWAL